LYTYSFVVDGVAQADPANTLIQPIATGGSESIVQVPGRSPLIWETRNVPHGVLHHHSYYSAQVAEDRDFWVYTPPGYEAARKRSFPVLYLLHGVMDDAATWTTAGRANVILDNLIADHKASPMLLVMPLGYGFSDVPDHMAEQFAGPGTQKKLMDAMDAMLVGELIPQVDRNYGVDKSARSRAIAGVSMGGSQALYFGLNHPEVFGWVGSFSGAFIMYGDQLGSWFPTLGSASKEKAQRLTISCGKEDFLLNVNRKLEAWLKPQAAPFTSVETPGGHTWNVWRRNLADFAPRLFHAEAGRTKTGGS
jgi:enterochelin esterase family protein